MTRRLTIIVSAVILLMPATVTAIWLSQGKEKRVVAAQESNSSAPARERSSNAKVERSPSPKRVIPMTEAGKIDWAAFLRNYEASSEEQYREYEAELKTLLAGMSDDELLAAMDEVAEIETKSYAQVLLASLPAELLAVRQPMLVLEHITGSAHGYNMAIGLIAYPKLLEQDPAAAERWLDTKIRDGFEFWVTPGDEKWYGRLTMEALLVASVREKDPMRAIERVTRFPEKQRAELLVESNDRNYLDSLNQALDYQEKTGDVSLLGSLIRDESMKYLVTRGDPEAFEQTRQSFERISDENLRTEANERLDTFAGMTVESVPLNLLLK